MQLVPAAKVGPPATGEHVAGELYADGNGDLFFGTSVGDDPDILREWLDRGIHWLSMGADFAVLVRAMTQLCVQMRQHRGKPSSA